MDPGTLCDCGHPPTPPTPSTGGGGGTGYGTDSRTGKTRCYPCCADADRAQMQRDGRSVLYLTQQESPTARSGTVAGVVTNWPGSLRIPCRVKLGRHNLAGTRRDVWFEVDGARWHGVQYGEWTQIVHCRRLAART